MSVTLNSKRLEWRDNLIFAGVDIDTAATHEIVAAVTGKTIYVYKLALRLNDSNTLTIQSGASAIDGMGDFVYGASGNFVYEDDTGRFPLPCTKGEAFQITLGSANGVVGGVWYTQE